MQHERRHTDEELAARAVQTAQEVRMEVRRWWVNEEDRRELYIETRTQDDILVVRVAIVPQAALP